MEVLLNLVWLFCAVLITAGAVIVCARSESSPRRRWMIGIAVFCLCVVLFPAISMTDDLEQVTFGAEESLQTLVLTDIHCKVHANVESTSLLPDLLTFQASFTRLDFARLAFATKAPLDGFLPSLISRPPPALVS